MKILYLILFCCVFTAIDVSPQSMSKIFRKCPGVSPSPEIAKVSVETSGNVLLADCSGQQASLRQGKFKLLDQNFTNFQGADCTFCVGRNDGDYSKIIGGSNANYYALDVEPVFTITNFAAGTAVFGRATGRVSSAFGSLYGGNFLAYSWGNKQNGYDGNLTMFGVRGSTYVRSQNESAAYGGYFDTFVGGNSGGTNTTPLFGVFAIVSGGHNGTTPNATAGKFTVTNAGGGGVGNITNAIGVQSVIDGSPSLTNFTTAKGISLEGWLPASGGTWDTSYGIYADTSIDRGTNRYFIYSLSTSPSLFSGDVSLNSGKFHIATPQTPASASATCTAGQVAWDANFVYVCIAANSWKRTSLATW